MARSKRHKSGATARSGFKGHSGKALKAKGGSRIKRGGARG